MTKEEKDLMKKVIIIGAAAFVALCTAKSLIALHEAIKERDAALLQAKE